MGATAGRDKADTQARILVAATELFIARGYEGATVSDIANRAGVSRTTVFWHFSDKAGLFRECFSRMLEPFRESFVRSWDDVDPSKRLEEQIAMSQRFTEEHGEEIFAFVRWAVESPQLSGIVVETLLGLNHRFAGALTETVSKLLPENRDPELVAHGLMLAFDASLLLSAFDERPGGKDMRIASVNALVALINRDAIHS
jgi:AcrR family transcriptional regulator